MKKLEASGIVLLESINKTKQITTLSIAPNLVEETVSNKLKNYLMKNNGSKFKNINLLFWMVKIQVEIIFRKI